MDKKILITGSTDGIGKLAAIQLAKEGHSVYLHGRNQQKLATSIEDVKTQSGSTQVNGFLADFSDFEAVKTMSREVKNQLPRLDVLINNAGVFNSPKACNKDGLDMRFVVNYLTPYLLTNELIPLLKNSNSPRILNLGSAAQAAINLADLKSGQKLSEQSAYAQSKLALTMWTFHLAEREKGITTIVVNPGSLLDTKMVHEAFGQVWASADKGANILRELATLEKYNDASGKYFDNDKGGFGRAHAEAYDQTKSKELIKLTEELIS
ncbi:MAG: SDR family NAD(P)-dependent oxidoreductase [Bacteroidota bacterium]